MAKKKSARKTTGRKKTRSARGRKRTAARRPSRAPGGRPAASAAVQSWPTDPMGGVPPLQRPVPSLPGMPLATQIVQPRTAPRPQVHPQGTDGFRYWTAAEALRRCAAFWAAAGVRVWHRNVGASIPVRLDDGVDLNAFYARNDFPAEDIKQGLSFFHDTVRDVATGRDITVFSGESPDIVSHELGHAVLDTLKPALFEIAAIEAAAFHESFGDMSAILTALQLPSVRQAVLEETEGRLARNSSVSRVAEQLGFAIRQRSPSAVDRDSLRNAANSFLYVDPMTLPANGPASVLTRAPHNFSRVFTGAFLEALGGMVLRLAAKPGEKEVLQASVDAGRLLAQGVRAAPVGTKFFQSVAEQMVIADGGLFRGKYAQALTTAFVRRGLMSVRSLAAPGAAGAPPARAAVAAAKFSAAAAGRAARRAATSETGVKVALDGPSCGLPVKTVWVQAPPVDDANAPAMTTLGGIAPREAAGTPRVSDVSAFVESLIARGRVNMTAEAGRRGIAASLSAGRKHATHYFERRDDDSVELKRIAFECW